MMMNNLFLTMLLKMTENDKRFLLIIILLLFVSFSLLVLLALLIEKISKLQAKKVDSLMHDVVYTGMIENKKQFLRVATKKNYIYFYKHARIAMLLIVLHFIAVGIYLLNMPESNYAGFFDYKQIYSFASIFPIFNFDGAHKEMFFGMFEIVVDIPLLNEPAAHVEGIFAYIAFPVLFVGIAMFLYQVQGLLARAFMIWKRSKTIFDKSLEGVKYDELNSSIYRSDAVTIEKTVNPANQDEKKE